MFTSFRQRLLFCFTVIISVSFAIVILTHFHFLFRDNISKTTHYIESAYILILKDINTKQNFFNYDTHNPAFFNTSKSENLAKHQQLLDSLHETIDKAYTSFELLPYTFDTDLIALEKNLRENEAVFDSITFLILERGYKDFSLEGSMRQHIHWLEKDTSIPDEKILSLRRLEKDYIIRNESEYVKKLNLLAEEIQFRYAFKKDSVQYHLKSYVSDFNNLVTVEGALGLKDNTGLKHKLDQNAASLEQSLNRLVIEAKQKQNEAFTKLNRIYVSLIALLVIGSIVTSFIISKKITKPLTELTQFITRFIDSQFTVEEQTPAVRTKDEIGKLTANFTLLKNEVISHLRYFKQKVDERTSELQVANKRLIEINEANSRFVPKEFLQFLGKNSIEEISPGDQVAREMTILFTDIRSFTEISELLSPQDNFDFINDYLKEIVPVIRANKGFIDKFIGDTVMAIFPNSPDDAIKAALEFGKAVDRFNVKLEERKIPPIAIGTGIHTGHLILGTIGNAHRLETTVISDAVNIASRIEGLTKYYHAAIVVSEETMQHAKNLHGLCFRYIEEVRVKGKLKSVRVYEILDPEKDKRKVAFLQEYETAMMNFREKRFAEARLILSELTLKNPEDSLPRVLLQKCQKYIEHGVPHEWDGIEIMQSK